MATGDRMTAVIELLRANGGRITSARRAILQALLDHPGHPTAEQLGADVHRRLPDVHVSTVYRFLDELEGLGVIEHVHLGHGPAIYHFADDLHHHLVCSGCGDVVELADRVLAPVRRKLRTEYGFEIDRRHFALMGRCRHCTGA